MVTPEDVVTAYTILIFAGIMLALVLVVGAISVVSKIRFRIKPRRYQYTKK